MRPIALTAFILSLIAGTTITLSSNHWLMAWIGLEINTLAIIPLMMYIPHPRSIEAAIKYFLTQSTASALILFSALNNAWLLGEWEISHSSVLFSSTLTIALLTKLGLAPMHFWMPEVIQGIPLQIGMILSTWQKIAPMILLTQMAQSVNMYLLTMIGIISILVGGWGGMNQTQTRKILAYSSIGHMGWIVLICKFNPSLALFTFFIYIIMTTTLFYSFSLLSAIKISKLSTESSKTPTFLTMLMLTLLSLGGLPPLSGFSPKLLIVSELVKQNCHIFAAFCLLGALLALFYYLRLTYYMILTLPPTMTSYPTQWRQSCFDKSLLSVFISSSLLLLPILPFFFES
uniref:NADH-ubiquinone oxidoreductase chain 2 n=1 Tax=Hemisus marmoratus TaxID=83971 RepID=S4V000_9NEOB|nr:NADH dehydrogenase subunit 2 [Hemisus marmoratus]